MGLSALTLENGAHSDRSHTEVCSVTNDSGQPWPLVLVVDGEQEVLEKIGKILREAKVGCRCCTTADEAVAAARACPPDLIICDWNFEGENGVETCQRIKEQPGLTEVPVMFLSSAQRPDVIRRSLDAGAGVYCLRKPFSATVLVELIDQALSVAAIADR
jgi:putative two-component system response regulator